MCSFCFLMAVTLGPDALEGSALNTNPPSLSKNPPSRMEEPISYQLPTTTTDLARRPSEKQQTSLANKGHSYALDDEQPADPVAKSSSTSALTKVLAGLALLPLLYVIRTFVLQPLATFVGQALVELTHEGVSRAQGQGEGSSRWVKREVEKGTGEFAAFATLIPVLVLLVSHLSLHERLWLAAGLGGGGSSVGRGVAGSYSSCAAQADRPPCVLLAARASPSTFFDLKLPTNMLAPFLSATEWSLRRFDARVHVVRSHLSLRAALECGQAD